jgi:predicted metal-binding protein
MTVWQRREIGEEKMEKAAMKRVEKMAVEHGLKDFKWIRPDAMLLGEWVRMKCNFGCPGYGKRKSCPPRLPPVEECRTFFREYQHGLFFHFPVKFKDPEMRHPWSREVNQKMLDLERSVFLSGYQKAFVFPQAPCRLCKKCAETAENCRQPYLSRPTLEAFGVDVYGTARKFGYPIQVVKDFHDEMNRYGLLLVE